MIDTISAWESVPSSRPVASRSLVKSSAGSAARTRTKFSQYLKYATIWRAMRCCSSDDARPHVMISRLPHHDFSSSISSSGNPIILKIVTAGSGKASSWTRSTSPEAGSASTSAVARSRITVSICAIRRAEKAREVCHLMRACSGGSRLDITASGRNPSLRIACASGTIGSRGACAIAAENVSGSLKIASTSS